MQSIARVSAWVGQERQLDDACVQATERRTWSRLDFSRRSGFAIRRSATFFACLAYAAPGTNALNALRQLSDSNHCLFVADLPTAEASRDYDVLERLPHVTADAGRDREVNVTTSPTRIFVKTQFNGTGASSILLSIGLVSDRADECYVELPPTGLHLAGAPPELRNRVVSQFGRVPGSRVEDRIGMSDRVAAFLNSFAAPIALMYDCRVDLSHLHTLVSQTREVFDRIRPYDVAQEISSPASKQAWSDQLKACSPRRIGSHHALAEALALKAAWFATPT